MTFLLWELGEKANSVCSTTNSGKSFLFSLVWLSSAPFCTSITDILSKSYKRSSNSIFFMRGINADNLKPIRAQDSLRLSHRCCERCNKLLFTRQEVHIGKNCAWGLGCCLRLQVEGGTQDKGHSFYQDRLTVAGGKKNPYNLGL